MRSAVGLREEDRGWHLTLFLLAAMGIVEAVVYLWRYRTAVDRFSWQSVASTFGVTATRVGFVVGGAGGAATTGTAGTGGAGGRGGTGGNGGNGSDSDGNSQYDCHARCDVTSAFCWTSTRYQCSISPGSYSITKGYRRHCSAYLHCRRLSICPLYHSHWNIDGRVLNLLLEGDLC